MKTQAPPDDRNRQRQARALGDPTRHRVFRYLEAATEPVTVAELTARFGLNHNAIRQHLATLRQAGLVVEDLAPPAGPGRRRLRYRDHPAAAAAWGGENPYEQLALLLVEMLSSGRSARDVGYEAGRHIRAPAGGDDADEVGAVVDLVARQGFAPEAVTDGESTDVVLGRCPYAAAASADPAVVCELHRGLVEGMAAAVGGGVIVTDLVPRNPVPAGCRLRLTTQGTARNV